MSLENPTNEQEFIAHCKINVSALTLNITPDQERIALAQALKVYLQNHYASTERRFISQKITQADLDNGFFKTPDNVIEVVKLLSYRRAKSVSGGMLNGTGMPFDYFTRGSGGRNGYFFPVTQYDTITSAQADYWLSATSYQNFMKHFGREDIYTWNPSNQALRIPGNHTFRIDDFIMYEAEISLQFEDKFWQNGWFISYMSARLKLLWGENLTKFSNVELPGGITLNGQELKNEAKTEIKELEDEVRDSHSFYKVMYYS